MIVVVGVPVWQAVGPGGSAGGLAAAIARAAAAEGARVELLGKTGQDATGDALLLDLTAAGVGHVAVLRDVAAPTPVRGIPEIEPADGPDGRPDVAIAELVAVEPPAPTVGDGSPNGRWPAPPDPGLVLEAGDVELGLRYLVDPRVIVVTPGLDDRAAAAVVEGAAFAGSHVIAIVAEGEQPPQAMSGATILELPDGDPAGPFSRLVGLYAAGLDRGAEPEAAFREATSARGWEPAG